MKRNNMLDIIHEEAREARERKDHYCDSLKHDDLLIAASDLLKKKSDHTITETFDFDEWFYSNPNNKDFNLLTPEYKFALEAWIARSNQKEPEPVISKSVVKRIKSQAKVPEGFVLVPEKTVRRAAEMIRIQNNQLSASDDTCFDEEEAEWWRELRDVSHDLLLTLP